jgi:hypothetical protein
MDYWTFTNPVTDSKEAHARAKRRLGRGAGINNRSFNPPAVKGQVYGYALVFALEHSQVFP